MPGALSTVVVRTTGVDPVPDAGHGGDDRRFAEALAQGGDGDAVGGGERVGALVPPPFQQLFSAHDPAFGLDEDVEHGERLAGERDIAAVPVDLPTERVQ